MQVLLQLHCRQFAGEYMSLWVLSLSRSVVARVVFVTLRNMSGSLKVYSGDVFIMLNIGVRPSERRVHHR